MGLMAKTKRGADPFEALSVIQKAIRRGDERLAAAYAYELGTDRKQTRTMVIDYIRQVVIYEDVGPFDPHAVVYAIFAMHAAKEATSRSNADDPKSERWSLPLVNAIVALCRCKKSRLPTHIWALNDEELKTKGLPPVPEWAREAERPDARPWDEAAFVAAITAGQAKESAFAQSLLDAVRAEALPDMPDYAKDMHTVAGKRMGRGIDHFLKNLVMDPKSDEPDPYEGPALELWKGQAAAERKPKPSADAVARSPRARSRPGKSSDENARPGNSAGEGQLDLFKPEPGWEVDG